MTRAHGGEEPAEQLAHPPRLDISATNVQQLLEQHAIDTSVRREELKLRRREMEAGFSYAEKALAVQERDLDNRRRDQLRGQRDRYLFLIMGLLIVTGFFIVALMMGKTSSRRRRSKRSFTWLPEEPVATSPEGRRGARAAIGQLSRREPKVETMMRKYTELRARMRPEERAAAHERAIEMLLATPPDELRRAMEMTDEEIAVILGMPRQAW